MMHDSVVRKTVQISAPVDRVWEALTNPALTEKYFFGSRAHSTWHIGSEIVFRRGRGDGEEIILKGKVINFRPACILQYSVWAPQSGLHDDPDNHTVITLRLSPQPGYTQVVATEENFDEDIPRHNISRHEWDIVLLGLKELFEEEGQLTSSSL